ncbi:uncharacterized protein LOC110697518 isoform X2 [Chenopodium quinoa]|uniref:uncharacterized protein LOC110697518 isoform X2 n=1 Tax=Chenopodium quinoa TaxID=63459 RepID=UPI000B788140|nr:uncharacterized protein LOC110697518 isoform X2 [Chenopodium quinoa]
MIFASFLPSKAGFDIFGLKLWGATALFFELVAVRAINAWSRAASWDCACERRCAGVGKEMNYCCELLLLVCVRWSCVSAEASGVKWGGEVAEMRSGSSDLQYIFYFSDGPMIWIAEIVKSSDDGSSIVNAHVDGAEISTVMIRMQDTDVEMRFPCESASNHDDCSTSSTHQNKNLKVCQKSCIWRCT